MLLLTLEPKFPDPQPAGKASACRSRLQDFLLPIISREEKASADAELIKT